MGTYRGTAFDALGDATRRRILERLAAGPSSVGELARGLPVSRPAVSQHLKVLKQAGLVAERRQGTRRIYGVDEAGVAAVREYWDGFWRRALAGFQAAAAAEAAAGADSERDRSEGRNRR